MLEVSLSRGGSLQVPFARRWVPEVTPEDGTVTLASDWRGLLLPVDP